MTALRKSVTYNKHDPFAPIRARTTEKLRREVEQMNIEKAMEEAIPVRLATELEEELRGFDPLTGGLV